MSVKSYITPQGPWTHSLQVGQNNGWEFQQELIVTWSWPLWVQRQELLESSPWATAQLVGFGFWNQRCHNATKAGSSGISKLTSSRNWSLSDGKPGLNMLGLMEIHALRSNIFILLVEQLFQLNLPPRSETDLEVRDCGDFLVTLYVTFIVLLSLASSHIFEWDPSPLSAAFSTKSDLVCSCIRC